MRTINTIDTDIPFHGVRRVGKSGALFQLQGLIQGFQSGFHCVILDLKDLPSHVLRNSDLQ